MTPSIDEAAFEVQWHLGGHSGICSCVRRHDIDGDLLTWLLVDQNSNAGMSVTNASHLLLPALSNRLGPRPHRVGDRWLEAYEYRIMANRGIDPDVTEIVWPGGQWLPVPRPQQPALAPLFDAWRRLAKRIVTIP